MIQTAIIIQARMGSSRLRGKVLLPLPEPSGRPVLAHILASATRVADTPVIVATSKEKADDELVEWLAQSEFKNVQVFRGSEDFVTERFLFAAREINARHYVRLTADNACIDSKLISESIESHIKSGADYTYTAGYPVGTNIEVATVSSLEKTYVTENLSRYDKEHVTWYARNKPEKFRHNKILADSKWEQFKHWRLTLDTDVDYASLSALFELLGMRGISVTMENLFSLALEKPWITRLNKNVFQKKPDISPREELVSARDLLKVNELEYAADLIARHIS